MERRGVKVNKMEGVEEMEWRRWSGGGGVEEMELRRWREGDGGKETERRRWSGGDGAEEMERRRRKNCRQNLEVAEITPILRV